VDQQVDLTQVDMQCGEPVDEPERLISGGSSALWR
jgi:hypothetical protein